MSFVKRIEAFGRNLELSREHFSDFQRMNEEVGRAMFPRLSELQEALDKTYEDLLRGVVEKTHLKAGTDVGKLQRGLSDGATKYAQFLIA